VCEGLTTIELDGAAGAGGGQPFVRRNIRRAWMRASSLGMGRAWA